MKEKRKDNSTILFIVGVVFVLLSGGICIHRAWRYLPVIAKQCMLFIISAACLTGSLVLARKGLLRKTENALFYIGDGFLGYFVFSVGEQYFLGLLGRNGDGKLVFFMGIVMAAPFIAKFFWKRRRSDFILSVLLCLFCIWVGYLVYRLDFMVYVVLNLIMLMGIGAALRACHGSWDTMAGGSVAVWVMFFLQELHVLGCYLLDCLSKMAGDVLWENVYVNVVYGILMLFLFVASRRVINQDIRITQICFIGLVTLALVSYNLSIDRIVGPLLFCSVCVLMILGGVWKEEKAIRIIGAVALAILFFDLTSVIWLSIAWWVYLMLAGMALIGIAVWREWKAER